MKNIHVLPTEKPSRLFEIIQFNLSFDSQNMYSEEYKKLHKYKNKNICITSDEEIKEGDYVYHNSGYVSIVLGFNLDAIKLTDAQRWSKDCKKIILTTDQDLIKDGVQAIYDDFLEWFVNNPSCDSIRVRKIGETLIYNAENKKKDMKNTIPQIGTKEFNDLASACFGGKHKQELSKDEIDKFFVDMICNPKQEPCDNCNNDVCCCTIKKQETLEEIAQWAIDNRYPKSEFEKVSDTEMYHTIIEKVSKWQQEQDKNKYSEEEVLNFTQTMIMQYKFGNTDIEQMDLLKETLQLFKNK